MDDTLCFQHPMLKQALVEAFEEVSTYVANLPEEAFVKQSHEKWSVAQNLEHLTLSVRPVASSLKLPKVAFKSFGKPNREVRTYTALVKRYKFRLSTQRAVAPSRYTPQGDHQRNKNDLLNDWNTSCQKLLTRMDKWTDKDLDSYLIPHPLLGKLMVREMLFFTHYHTLHHLEAMKRQQHPHEDAS